jgi:hypothetical protein
MGRAAKIQRENRRKCGVPVFVHDSAELPPLRSYSNASSVYLGGDLLRFCG